MHYTIQFKHLGFLTLLSCFLPLQLMARPLITRELNTLGRNTFEAGFSISERIDEFNTPRDTYQTVFVPVYMRFGLFKRLDVGLELEHASHRLDTNGKRLKGSKPARFSPEIKLTFSDSLGILGVLEVESEEENGQDIPISRGNNYEILALYKFSSLWPLQLNAGVVLREEYSAQLGIQDGPNRNVDPGTIFETSLALEIPMKKGFFLLSELAYYDVANQKLDGITVQDSAGQALDALVGMVWVHKGWNIGLGASFGLLDESHTSFDINRGAGEVSGKFAVSYKLKPKRPGR